MQPEKLIVNFRDEREHDKRLMELVKALDQAGRLDILETGLGLPTLGQISNMQRRRAFDIEFEFRERRLLVETKVDSDESGRWEAISDAAAWQTSRMATRAREGDVCLFITYGFAEFFTKWFDFGAASTRVRHIKLDQMVDLVTKALQVVNSPLLCDWLAVLRAEQDKRRAMPAVLTAFAEFRRTYLQIARDVDFTPTRIGINAPEIAFPALAHLLEQWRISPYSRLYGHVSLYPVPRKKPLPADSVLNWFELWRDRPALTIGGVLFPEKGALYFEVNEDFNLHLKFDAKASDCVAGVREEVATRLKRVTNPAVVVACRPELHKQQVYAVWEWDLDLPARIYAHNSAAVDAIGTLFDAVLPELK